LSLGLVLVASQEAHAAVSPIAWWMAICGVGFGFFQSRNNRTILASAPREHAGSASGILASAFGPPRGCRSHCLVRDSGAQPECLERRSGSCATSPLE
jgi:hypothetical protein